MRCLVRELNENKERLCGAQGLPHSDVNKTSRLPTVVSVKFFSFLEMIRNEKGMEP